MLYEVITLLDERDTVRELRERRRLGDRAPERDHVLDVRILLVAVERRRVAAGNALEHRRDRAQALEVGRKIAADLELEPAVPVGSDDS